MSFPHGQTDACEIVTFPILCLRVVKLQSTSHTLADWEKQGRARKRSLVQGNIFRSVCQEFYSQVAGLPQCMHPPLPPGTRHPPRTRQVPPRTRHPLGPGTPPGPGSSLPGTQAPLPEQGMLGDTVNERVVCILLECNLVFMVFFEKFD